MTRDGSDASIAPETQEARAGSARRRCGIRHTGRWLAVLLCGVIAARVFIVEPYCVPTGSMEPTLVPGDCVLANKLAFGTVIPLTRWRLPGYAAPARGEVVIFADPERRMTRTGAASAVKRIVGVGGDTLYMRAGAMYRNGLKAPSGVKPDTASDPQAPDPAFAWQREVTLKNSRFGPPPSVATLDNWGPIVVPHGLFFVLGDARYASQDSRHWGFVPRDDIRARPVFVYRSRGQDFTTRGASRAIETRWERVGMRIR